MKPCSARRSSQSIALSVLLHLLLFIILFIGFDFQRRSPLAPDAPGEVIKASLVDAQQLRDEVEKLEQAEKAQQQKLADEKKRLVDAEAARKRAEQRKQQALDAERRAAEKKRQAEAAAKVAAEKKRQADVQAKAAREKQQKIAAETAASEKAAADRAAARAREVAAEKAAARRAQDLATKALQNAMAAEESHAQQQRDRTLVEQYEVAIQQQIQRAWSRPDDWPAGLTCKVAVRLMPGGAVLSAKRIGQCGGDRFGQSAERAVLSASPLPVPDDLRVFKDNFRNFSFYFNPTEGTD